MPRFSVCVEMVYRPLPFVERIEAVARAGYDAFEFWNWQDKDLEAVEATSRRLGLAVAAFGVSGGTLMDAANHDAYIETTHRAAAWARRLGCPNLIVTTGNEVTGVSRAAQFDVLHRGLERVAAAAADGGVVAVLEPLNTKVDHAGYFLDHAVDAFRLVRDINSSALRVLYDMYHMQIMDGDLIATIEANLDLISHFHVADVPGRHEPGTGEINYAFLFDFIDKLGYSGWIGCEYKPLTNTDAGVGWVRKYLS